MRQHAYTFSVSQIPCVYMCHIQVHFHAVRKSPQDICAKGEKRCENLTHVLKVNQSICGGHFDPHYFLEFFLL